MCLRHRAPSGRLVSSRLRHEQIAIRRYLGRVPRLASPRSAPADALILDWSFILAVMASPLATIQCVDAFGKTDFRKDLASFIIPTLIIHGTSDKIVPMTFRAVPQRKESRAPN